MKVKWSRFLGEAEKFLRKPNNLLMVGVVLVMGLFAIKCVSEALTNTFSFDGGIIIQSAQSLARNFQYSTFYQAELFDPLLTSAGITVALPAALLFRIFGESFEVGLMVSAIYLILILVLVVYYLKKCWKVHNALILLAVLLFYGTPSLTTNGLGFYGEIPMFFYLMLMLISLNKYEATAKTKFLFGAGLFLGLAYLTKTIALIWIPALIFAGIFDYLVKRRSIRPGLKRIRGFFQEYILLPVGFLVPVVVFELFKLISLGAMPYLQWWKYHLSTIGFFTGVKQANSEGIFTKFFTRLDTLSSFVNIDRGIIVFLLALVFLLFMAVLIYGIVLISKKRQLGTGEKTIFSVDVVVLITVTLSYYGWWLIISYFVWERYLFIGYILLELCLVLIISLLVSYRDRIAPKTKHLSYLLYQGFFLGFVALLLVGSVYNLVQTGIYRISFKDLPEKTAYLEAGQFIRSLPENAQVFGYSYWQAPLVSFTANRIFVNILTDFSMRNPGPLDEKYFVVDFYAYYLDPGGFSNILGQYDHQLVFSDEEQKLYIYKLNTRPVFAYEPFTNMEKSQVAYSAIDFTRGAQDSYVRNVYTNEISIYGNWAQEVSAYLFKYNGEHTLKIDLYIPDLQRYNPKPAALQIYADRQLIIQYNIDQSGPKQITVPLENISGDTLEVTLMLNSRINAENYTRHLSFLLQNMELIK